MNKKLTQEELDKLIELASQPSTEEEKKSLKTPDNDFEEFVSYVNLVPGDSKIPVGLIWDFYSRWTKTKPKREPFFSWMKLRFDAVQVYTKTFYLIDENSLFISRKEMMREIIERLNEKKKIKRKKKKT
ncbi:MAG: hypothetical protein H7831_14675 [Magnetococcus sp. WYHC-3]